MLPAVFWVLGSLFSPCRNWHSPESISSPFPVLVNFGFQRNECKFHTLHSEMLFNSKAKVYSVSEGSTRLIIKRTLITSKLEGLGRGKR